MVKPPYVRYTALVAAIYLAVFISAYFQAPRRFLGAGIDLLPALFIYIGTVSGIVAISALAILGGVWFDSFSANPIGVTILPLFLIGAAVWANKHNLLYEQRYAQMVLGAMATAVTPLVSLFLLYAIGAQPLLGWRSLWQWAVMIAVGALVAPVWFGLFNRLNRALFYPPASEYNYRQDREIDRGRS